MITIAKVENRKANELSFRNKLKAYINVLI